MYLIYAYRLLKQLHTYSLRGPKEGWYYQLGQFIFN